MLKTIKKLFASKSNEFLKGIETPVYTKIKEKTILNHDTYILKCEIPENYILGVPTGQHIRIFNKCGEKSKSFTPVSEKNKKGEFDLLIKTYFPNKNFPEGGNLSQYINSLKENDYLKIVGPKGRMYYKKEGRFLFKKRNFNEEEKNIFEDKLKNNNFSRFRKISMIGGGTGITPLYQIALQIKNEKNSDIKIKLLFANKCEKDIFFKKEIEDLNINKNFETEFLIEEHFNKNWKGLVGIVNDKIIHDFFWKPSDDHLFIICGSKPMVQCIEDLLVKKGFNKENIFGY